MSGATLLASLVAALANVIGALAVAGRRNWSVRALELMIALSAGFMLSVAIADIIPEAISLGGKLAGAVVLTGFVLVHVTQHVFVRHFHFGEETHVVARNVAASALVGLLLHTLIDGVKHPWKAGDVINLPLRRDGIVVQHFNDDADKPVRFIAAEPNFFECTGVDRGSGFEQLQDAPEYRRR